jgi:16S rRNA (adenine1518-N6/adenine1519-N6)-dimethyltransferase
LLASNSQSIIALLKKYNLRPRKGLGQNFLVDSFHLEKVIAAASLSPEDTVLEIGPGPGTLTRFLTGAAGHVIAVEVDPGMINLLQNEYGNHPNLSIIQADILKTDVGQLITSSTATPHPSTFKVVANLPYYITSAVMRHLLESTLRPQQIVVTVQKEVAQRIVAQPGRMSVLAVSVQFYGQPVLFHHIPAGAFYPPPKVDSAVVRIDTFANSPLVAGDTDHFFRIVKAGFSQKRKQLKNSLAGGLQQPVPEVVNAMQRAGIDPARRAETLSLAEWSQLAGELE